MCSAYEISPYIYGPQGVWEFLNGPDIYGPQGPQRVKNKLIRAVKSNVSNIVLP